MGVNLYGRGGLVQLILFLISIKKILPQTDGDPFSGGSSVCGKVGRELPKTPSTGVVPSSLRVLYPPFPDYGCE